MALTAARKATKVKLYTNEFPFLVKAGVVIFPGALVVLELSSGYAKPGVTGTGLVALGRAENAVDNTGGTDGVLASGLPAIVKVRQGILKYAIGSAPAVTDVMSDLWIVDDETVSLTASGKSRAGTLIEIDPDGDVWVLVDFAADSGDAAVALAAAVAAQTDVDAVEAILGNVTKLQLATGTLVAGGAVLGGGGGTITVTALTRAFPIPGAVVTGSTNFGSLAHLFASNVVGGPGTGAVTINALGSDGAKDTDAAGAFACLLIN